MWKQVWNGPRIWRRVVVIIAILGVGALVFSWHDGGFYLWVGALCFAVSFVVVTLYLLRRLPIPYR